MHDGSNGSDESRRAKRISIFPRSPVKPEEARWKVAADEEAQTKFFVRTSSPSFASIDPSLKSTMPSAESPASPADSAAVAGRTARMRVSGPMSFQPTHPSQHPSQHPQHPSQHPQHAWLEPNPRPQMDTAFAVARPTWSDASLEPAVVSLAPASQPPRAPQIAMFVATVGMLALVAVGAIVRTTLMSNDDEAPSSSVAAPPPLEASDVIPQAPPTDTIFAATVTDDELGTDQKEEKPTPAAKRKLKKVSPKSAIAQLPLPTGAKEAAGSKEAASPEPTKEAKKPKKPATGTKAEVKPAKDAEMDLANDAERLAREQLEAVMR